MKQVQSAAPAAYKRASTLESTLSYMGSVMSLLARGEDTGGRFALVDIRMKPGSEPPPHVHEWEHEMFYVLEGVAEFYCEDKVMAAGAGEVVFIPQGKPHAFYVRSARLRALALVQAAGERAVGIDRYFIEMGEPAKSMELPAEALTYRMLDDPSHAISLGAANGIRFLSPEETAKELPRYPGFGVNLEEAVGA